LTVIVSFDLSKVLEILNCPVLETRLSGFAGLGPTE
jgi:hypothetical protein